MTGKPEELIEADAHDLVELFEQAGSFVAVRSLSDYWLYARLFGSTCLCIRSDSGEPVAAIIAFRDQTPGKSEIYVQDVAVHPAHRRRGLGEALLSELHTRAVDWGIKRIWLTSEAENISAMSLWCKLGYENLPADYQTNGVWLTSDLKGPGRDRAVYEARLDT